MGSKNLKNFFQKNMKSLVVPIIMIVLGLMFIIAPNGATKMMVKAIGIMFVIAGVFMAGTLINRYSQFMVILAAFFGIMGIVFIVAAGAVANFVLRLIGIIILVNSLFRMMDAYRIKSHSDKFNMYMLNDVMTAILGVLLLICPWGIDKALSIVAGVILLFFGVSNLITAYRVYNDGRYVETGTDVVWEEDGFFKNKK